MKDESLLQLQKQFNQEQWVISLKLLLDEY